MSKGLQKWQHRQQCMHGGVSALSLQQDAGSSQQCQLMCCTAQHVVYSTCHAKQPSMIEACKLTLQTAKQDQNHTS